MKHQFFCLFCFWNKKKTYIISTLVSLLSYIVYRMEITFGCFREHIHIWESEGGGNTNI